MAVELVTIKIRKNQYTQLTRIKGFYQAKTGETWSMADVLDEIMDKWPGVEGTLPDNMFKVKR